MEEEIQTNRRGAGHRQFCTYLTHWLSFGFATLGHGNGVAHAAYRSTMF
jgi:hypothetical protein